MDAVERGKQHFRSFDREARSVRRRPYSGPLLDFGCGTGNFVKAALEKGYRAHGLDTAADRVEAFAQSVSPEWTGACVAYDGSVIPFPNETFSLVHSWFVFEHLANPFETMCEISRVSAPSAIFVLNAQDGRTLFEGHAKIPWMPFLPEPLRSAWVDELTNPETHDYMMRAVYMTTVAEVASTLEFFGWSLLGLRVRGDNRHPPLQYPANKDEARIAAREAMRLHEEGKWPKRPLDYKIVAVKKRYRSTAILRTMYRANSFVRRGLHYVGTSVRRRDSAGVGHIGPA